MNPSQKESVMEEMNSGIKKCCADCKTTKTPLWRSGPAGPKSLCNACGIRYRKRRSAMMGLNSVPDMRKDKPATNNAAAKKTRSGGGDLSEDLRVRLMALGKEMVMLQRQRSPVKKRQRTSSTTSSKKLGEEEQAAILLMALSCGSVFA